MVDVMSGHDPQNDDTAAESDTSLLTQVLTSRLMLCNRHQSPSGLEQTSATARVLTGLKGFQSPEMHRKSPPPLLRGLSASSLHDEPPSHPPSPCSTVGLTPTLRNARLGTTIAASAHAPGPFLIKTHRQLGRACIRFGRMGLQTRTAFPKAAPPQVLPSAPPTPFCPMCCGKCCLGEKGGGSAG